MCRDTAFSGQEMPIVIGVVEAVVVDTQCIMPSLPRVVVEPGKRSFQTAQAIVTLAQDLGVTRVFAVANKVRPGDEEIIRQELNFLPILGFMPYDPAVISADLSGVSVFEQAPEIAAIGYKIKNRLLGELGKA